MQILKRLWSDDIGFVASTDLLLLTTLLVLGMIVGLVTFRDQVVQELGDTAAAIGAINQSYSYSAGVVTFSFAPMVTGTFSVAGSSFTDLSDFCDVGDTAGAPPECIVFAPEDEEG